MSVRRIKDSSPKAKSSNSQNYFYVIGIGTSAGGLRALTSFFESCPINTGMAFVVVQHLAPDYKSLMPELLSKITEMNVEEAKDKVEVKPDNVYLIPGGKNLTIVKGKLKLVNRPPTNQINFSIDIFFESLAKDKAHLAIGVILSGTGSDGTKGSKAIKEVGGTVFVQTPDSSSFDGMPKSVISHNLADNILTPKEMPDEIMQYVQNPQFNYLVSGVDLSHEMDTIHRILKVVKDQSQIDFRGYKMPTILRRTAKRLNLKKCESIEDYLNLLYEDQSEAKRLGREYLISVTNFFRNPEVFDYLKSEIFPDLIKNAHENKEELKFWIIACATGEEVYSLAIMLEECIRDLGLDVKYKMYATDVDEPAIEVASKGIYSRATIELIDPAIVNTYFVPHDKSFRIIPKIRAQIIFSKHNIVVNPPFNKMDFVSFRNLLIYLDTDFKAKAINAVKYSLKNNGYLLLGNSETPGIYDKSFKAVHNKFRIYQNLNAFSFSTKDMNNWIIDKRARVRATGRQKVNTVEEVVDGKFLQRVVEHYQSATVCVDDYLTIIHATGKFKRYISIPEDGYSNNLAKLVNDNILIPVQSSIRVLNQTEQESVAKDLRVSIDNQNILLRIIVEKLNDVKTSESVYLLTFLEVAKLKVAPVSQGNVSIDSEEIVLLQASLKETKENLQLTIEELETSNEEMQATNEELLAANEEMQSTNEELQSVNEELHTVNAELQSKNSMLIELNSDVDNLFKNLQVGTLFLDENNCIRKYTPKVQAHYGFREEDIGRSITLYSGTIMGKEIVKIADRVKSTGKKEQIEVQHPNGSWFWIEFFPYIGTIKEITGVTINFINIDDIKGSNEELQKLYTFLNEFNNATPTLATIFNLETGKIEYVTGSIESFLGISKKEIEEEDFNLKSLIYPADRAIYKEHFAKIKLQHTDENIITKVRIENKKRDEIHWMLLSSKVYRRDRHGKPIKSTNVLQNISTLVEIENELKSSEERYRLALSSQKVGLWECADMEQGNVWWSAEYKNLLGYKAKEYKKGYEHFISIIHDNDYDTYIKELEISFDTEKAFSSLLKLKIHDGTYRWFEVNGVAERSQSTGKKRVICSIADVHEKVLYQKIIESKQRLLDDIFDNSPVGILIADGKGIIKEFSKGFTKIIEGKDKSKIIGRSLIDFSIKADKKSISKEFGRLVNFEIPFIVFDKRLRTFNDEEKQCYMHISRIDMVSAEGESENVYCAIISDRTRKLNFENELTSVKRQLESLCKKSSETISFKIDNTINDILHITNQNVDLELAGQLSEISSKLKLVNSDINTQFDELKLLNFNSEHTQINLNKLVKKVAKEFSIQEIKLSYDILPGIIAIESEMELLFKKLISSLAMIRGARSKSEINIFSEYKENKWSFDLYAERPKRLSINSKEVINFVERSKGLRKQEELQLKLTASQKIIKNHNGELAFFDNQTEKKLGFSFSILDDN